MHSTHAHVYVLALTQCLHIASHSVEMRTVNWRFITLLSVRFCQVIRQALDKYISLIPNPGRLPQIVSFLDGANYMMHQCN